MNLSKIFRLGSVGYSDFPAYSQILIRQLSYLKRIIVIPAVYQLLAPLKRSFKYRHWADVTDYTHHYWLAVSYVFVKQSDYLSHQALHLHPYEYKCRDPLYRRYRANLPNSLN